MDIYKISKLDLFAILATKSDIDDARIALTSEGKPFDQVSARYRFARSMLEQSRLEHSDLKENNHHETKFD
jgi:hypothetical protein